MKFNTREYSKECEYDSKSTNPKKNKQQSMKNTKEKLNCNIHFS